MAQQYKAFLSYSHADEVFARWLHRQLEGWKVPRDLVGRVTPTGAVPRTLRPVFRDRDDFSGGSSLKDATIKALEASEFLVVICSPNSAASQYVNEEVRLFKAMGRGDRIIPVIIAGEPGSANDECFPDAVKYVVDESGAIGTDAAEPIAADARESGDGRVRALAKVVAGLLGVAFDEITRRAEQARRRRVAIAAGTGAGAFLFATGVGTYALYESYQAGVAIDRSVFAIAGMIGRTDDIDASTDLSALRSEMLRTECDLIQGLARGRRAMEPREATICQNEQARALFERGDKAGAIAGTAAWLTRMRTEFESTTPPKLDLAIAYVKAGRELYVLRSAAEDPLQYAALKDVIDISAKAGHAFLTDQYIRNIHEDAIWRYLPYLEKRKDWKASRAIMEGATELRAQQASVGTESERYGAAMEHGVYLRRLGWLALRHLNDKDVALKSAQQAVALFGKLKAPEEGAVRFAHQSALAHEVLADTYLAAGNKAAAASGYQAALEWCNRALNSKQPIDNEMRQTLNKEMAYLRRQMALVQ